MACMGFGTIEDVLGSKYSSKTWANARGRFAAAGAAFVLLPSTSARAASAVPPTAGREASTEVMTGSNAEAV